MKKNTLLHGVLIVLFTLLLNASARSQESFYKVTLSDQIDTSTFIAEGKVLSSHSFWDNSGLNIYTAHMIEIFKVFKGLPQSKIQIITRGGVVGLEAEVVSNSLRLRKDDLGVFILSESNIGTDSYNQSVNSYKSVSANQGFYRYSLENDMVLNPFEIYKGIDSNFYNLLSINTKSTAVLLNSFDVSHKIVELSNINTRVMNPVINSFSATDNSAGTGSVLTINGANFGSSQGSVGFRDADLGGVIFTNTLNSQILSWADNLIEVEIPDHSGTGNFRVSTSGGVSAVSGEDLLIDFAQINIEFNLGSGNIAFPTQHIDNNGSGGNTWEMNTGFFNSDAKIPFEQALETWSCETGINWNISINSTSNNTVADDNQNVIAFSDLSAGLLGQSFSRYSGCLVDSEVQWFVEELDMVFNSNINWNFSSNNPATNEVDFQSVALHELGHGHQLGHVIDDELIMHFSLPGGTAQRDLSTEDLRGAAEIMSRTTTNSACNEPVMVESACFLASSTLNSNNYDLDNSVQLFPNPASTETFIKSPTGIFIDTVVIYNVEGKMIYSVTDNLLNTEKRLDLVKLTSGLYFVIILVDNRKLTKKLIIN